MGNEYQTPFDADVRSNAGAGAPAADATTAAKTNVVTDAERSAVARIRVKALIWTAVFLVLLIAAVVAGTDRSGGPAQGAPVEAVVTAVDTRRGSVTVSADGLDSELRHRKHSEFSYHPGERLEAYAYDGEIHETLDGVTNATALSRAYPWLASGAFALGVVALVYMVGWRRSAATIRDAAAGDPIAIAYLKRGPRLGTTEWWWATPPVRPSVERRKVLAMGVVLMLGAVAFAAIEVVMWMLGPSPATNGLRIGFAFAGVAFLVPAVWCFVFVARPSKGTVRVLGWLRWALVALGVIGLIVTWMLSHDVYACGAIAMVYGSALTLVRAIRSVAVIALPGPVTMPRYRERIDEDIARRARAQSQVASEGWGLDMVRAKRERRMFLRYTLISIGFLLVVGILAWAKTGLGVG